MLTFFLNDFGYLPLTSYELTSETLSVSFVTKGAQAELVRKGLMMWQGAAKLKLAEETVIRFEKTGSYKTIFPTLWEGSGRLESHGGKYDPKENLTTFNLTFSLCS